ncbi:sugar phosphate isomerase/epimerase [Asticcacaulis sp. 201]|uniref:sugar phosphate isomerase/epimerase family protein n=1 Tax=Asticcacaulis sp. 201 TaxID=3028787 RepID=UPI0029166EAA|nr:sugar phosphate isomerase/epimerase [Asticcacaulis sp. 201]MDV6332281.1 sugar phosphate isomerase/epimerase [Asticcacaulis sp. 201]
MTAITASRRHMLFGAAALLALSGCKPAPSATPASDSAATKTAIDAWPVGMQLWTVGAELAKDVPGTLKAVKDAGYDVVETAGTQGKTAAEFKTLIEAAGLKARSAHTNMPKLIENADKEINEALALGVEWLICSSPQTPAPLPAGSDWIVGMTKAMTADAWKMNAEHMAKIAPLVKKAGLKFGYHNHPMEFKDLGGGQTGYDILMSAGDASLIRAELDLGWVAVAGLDPVATMKKYADRLDLLHIKDMIKDEKQPAGFRSTEIGHGMIDWKPVFAAAQTLGVKNYFVEQEPPFLKPAIESLKESRAFIAAL